MKSQKSKKSKTPPSKKSKKGPKKSTPNLLHEAGKAIDALEKIVQKNCSSGPENHLARKAVEDLVELNRHLAWTIYFLWATNDTQAIVEQVARNSDSFPHLRTNRPHERAGTPESSWAFDQMNAAVVLRPARLKAKGTTRDIQQDDLTKWIYMFDEFGIHTIAQSARERLLAARGPEAPKMWADEFVTFMMEKHAAFLDLRDEDSPAFHDSSRDDDAEKNSNREQRLTQQEETYTNTPDDWHKSVEPPPAKLYPSLAEQIRQRVKVRKEKNSSRFENAFRAIARERYSTMLTSQE